MVPFCPCVAPQAQQLQFKLQVAEQKAAEAKGHDMHISKRMHVVASARFHCSRSDWLTNSKKWKARRS